MDEIANNHHVDQAWAQLMTRIRAEIAQRGVHPARTVVLVPYAQLMQPARSAWVQSVGPNDAATPLFMPRFETTMNWTRSLGGFMPEADDLHLDCARDVLTASSLLSRAGVTGLHDVLASRLLESAWSLTRIAQAQAPSERMQWGVRLGVALAADLQAPVFALDAVCARVALAWAANSSYPTDAVFSATPELLVLLEGFQSEPLYAALQRTMGTRVLALPLDVPAIGTDPLRVQMHKAEDPEDEARRACACVLAHLAAGRAPVALVAQDRSLTRRVRAMLASQQVAVRDETGWKLSTTRAAACVMALLRAGIWNASTDAVLDWLKHAPAFDVQALSHCEGRWRALGLREWRAIPADALVRQARAVLGTLAAARPLVRWLADVRAALQAAGQWPQLVQDPAGAAVLDALRLREGCEQEFGDVAVPMRLSAFTNWVSQSLEAAHYMPAHPEPAAPRQVVILPMTQLLGRCFAAVVMPGCDEVRLPTAPEPSGMWTPDQRTLLGLPTREQLARDTRAAWHYALRFPWVDVLWRQSDGGEQLMASGLVQELRLAQAASDGLDCARMRAIPIKPCGMPTPSGQSLPVARLSSSAYEDLRRCPYRFFSLRQLRLQEVDELDTELGKRDFGTWLHTVLHQFHEALKMAPPHDLQARIAMLNVAAQEATESLGLTHSEFLPFAATWPRVRAGYLAWLAEHESSGASYSQGEVWKETALARWTLVGKIDRVDRQGDGTRLVIDYKTESRDTTSARLKQAQEDTQLAFYAALLHDDVLSAAYVNVGEKEPTRTYLQPDIVALRDQLLEGILSDMERIAQGARLAALGEGKACAFCAARGLCRKDFWS